MGRVIPGFDYGLEGMKIGGKRRIFIPWQMAYGTARSRPSRPPGLTGPGIPAKSDLIFDVELGGRDRHAATADDAATRWNAAAASWRECSASRCTFGAGDAASRSDNWAGTCSGTCTGCFRANSTYCA